MNTDIAIITKALAESRITQHDERTIASSLAVMVQGLFAAAGQTTTPNDVALIVREVLRDLTTRYKQLTLQEVKVAMDNGIRGDYGSYYGINVVSINKWLRAYHTSDERKEALQANVPLLPPRTPLSDNEKNAIMERAYKKCVAGYCKNKIIKDYGNAVYNWLDAQGKIHLTIDEKRKIYEEARVTLKAEAKRQAEFTPVNCKLPIINFIKLLEENPNDVRLQIISKAKKIALGVVFKAMQVDTKNKLTHKNIQQ